MKLNNTIVLIAILIFLGVSPIGEPHIIGKINLIKGGAKGMSTLDWFDVVLHGGALITAVVMIIYLVYSRINKK